MSQIEELILEKKEKSFKIVELQNTIHKQKLELKQKDEKINQLEVLLRERTHKINKLNSEFFLIQQEVIALRSIQQKQIHHQEKVEELQQIIKLQSEQIANYLQDQHNYIGFVEELYRHNGAWFQERALLYEYRTELERQIEDVQNINEQLIGSKDEYLREIQQQNQQGNDLLGQIQYMIECCEGVE